MALSPYKMDSDDGGLGGASDIEALDTEELEEQLIDPDPMPVGGQEWKKRMPSAAIPDFVGKPGVKPNITDADLATPSRLFGMFINRKFIQHIVAQTNLFWAQECAAHPGLQARPFEPLGDLELYAWLGICIANGCHPVPSMKLIWGSEFGYAMPRLASVMTLTRSSAKWQFFHYSHKIINKYFMTHINSYNCIKIAHKTNF